MKHAPECVGIVMDGNRRFAKVKGLPTFEGHRAGVQALRRVALLARDRGIRHLAVYAFSTENWNRTSEEVSYLMNLILRYVRGEAKELGREGVRIRIIGQKERFSADMRQALDDIEKETQANDAITLWVCLSYGGRAEIAAAARAAAATGEEMTEEAIARHVWAAGMPDPDLIIRTGGEKRLSGFLTWQSVYSELFFIDTFWPDFGANELDAVLAEFGLRERRHGK